MSIAGRDNNGLSACYRASTGLRQTVWILRVAATNGLDVDGALTPTTAAIFGTAVYTVDARLPTPFVGPYKVFRVER